MEVVGPEPWKPPRRGSARSGCWKIAFGALCWLRAISPVLLEQEVVATMPDGSLTVPGDNLGATSGFVGGESV